MAGILLCAGLLVWAFLWGWLGTVQATPRSQRRDSSLTNDEGEHGMDAYPAAEIRRIATELGQRDPSRLDLLIAQLNVVAELIDPAASTVSGEG